MIPLALFSWPVIVASLFNRFNAAVALCVAIIGGYLLLPNVSGYNLPMLPSWNKDLAPAAAAIVMVTILLGRTRGPGSGGAGELPSALPGWIPRSRFVILALVLLVGGSFATVLTNKDWIVAGERSLRGLTIYDGFSAVQNAIVAILPFLLGRRLLARPEGQRVLLLTLCISATLYAFLALYEVRMSPQLNRMIYGFFGNDWRQHMRNGGYRPLVFLQHALWLANYLALGLLSALALARRDNIHRSTFLLMAVWIVGTIVLGKSLGALLISIALGGVLIFGVVRIQLLVAAIIAGFVLFYPMMRGAGLVPTDKFLSLASDISYNRASSLRFRFDNEDILLEKAQRKPAFGWGTSGRSRVYDDQGRDISITDGQWIINIGQWGWIGYLARFGLLCIPIIVLTVNRRRWSVGPETAGLCVVLAANLVDLIPNATLTPVTWLLAGALTGRTELAANATASAGSEPAAEAPPARLAGGGLPAFEPGAAARQSTMRTGRGPAEAARPRSPPMRVAHETGENATIRYGAAGDGSPERTPPKSTHRTSDRTTPEPPDRSDWKPYSRQSRPHARGGNGTTGKGRGRGSLS